MPRQLQLTESLNEKMGKIREAQNLINEAQKEFRRTMKQLTRPVISEMAADIMRAHPEITAIRWSQYTPYFNDGSPCTFRVYEPEFQFSDSFVTSIEELQYEKYVCENSEGFYNVYSSGRGTPEFLKKIGDAQNNFNLLLEHLEDGLEDAFGDHAEVTVKPNGTITVERCDHD